MTRPAGKYVTGGPGSQVQGGASLAVGLVVCVAVLVLQLKQPVGDVVGCGVGGRLDLDPLVQFVILDRVHQVLVQRVLELIDVVGAAYVADVHADPKQPLAVGRGRRGGVERPGGLGIGVSHRGSPSGSGVG